MTDESRNNPPTCPDCGTEIPTGTPEGMCPQCLLGGGLDPDGETLPSNPANPSRNPVQKLESAGSSVGRYKLLQQIGEGGFGTVYLAQQTEPVKRKVALKVIKAGMDSKEIIARFEAERQALALMNHPNIAQVHDAGTTDSGRPYFVMELVKGVPITSYCADQNLDTKARLELFNDVCAAVQHAHQKGVIHRDLKPSNILVSPHDGKPVVKVIDFGIAKAISMELSDKTMFTQLGQMMGTPQYMSPEQAELNALDIDTRSDIYSLGVVLYELLTGTTPLDGEKLRSAAYDEMQRLIREDAPVKPSTRVSTARHTNSTSHSIPTNSEALKGDLDWITMKALEKDRARRYETASAMAQDISRHLGDQPVLAGPPSASYRMGKFARRNRGRIIGGAIATAALLVGLAVAGLVWMDARFEKRERAAESEFQATTLLDEAERLMAINAEIEFEDASNFYQARELSERLALLAGIDEAGSDITSRRNTLLKNLILEEKTRAFAAEIEEGLIEDLAHLDPTHSNSGSVARAFERYGMDPLGSPEDEVVATVMGQREAVRERIIGGLFEWANSLDDTDPEEAARLNRIIARCDSDPWLQSLQEAVEEGDKDRLVALADSPQLAERPMTTLQRLTSALEKAQLADAAEKLMRRAQREAPESFWSNFLLGIELAASKDPKDTQNLTKKIIRAPDLRTGSFLPGGSKKSMLGTESVARPGVEEAIGFLRVAANARPSSDTAWMFLGITLAGGGHVEEAISSLHRAIRLNPEVATAHMVLGTILVGQRRHQEAIAPLERALEIAESMWVYYHLGIVLAELGRYDEALVSFRKAADQKEGESGSIRFSGGFESKDPTPDEKFAMYRGFLATIQMDRGDLTEALASTRFVIEAVPDLAQAHLSHALVLSNTGELAASMLACQRALELDPRLAEAHLFLGLGLWGKGDLERALSHFRLATKLKPEDPQGHCNFGGALVQIGEVDEGIASLEKAIELDPEFPMALHNLGLALQRKGEAEEALAFFQRAVDAGPDFEPARRSLAGALLKSGKPEEVIATYREVTLSHPDDAKAHANLAEVLATQDRFEEALASCQRAIELDPDLAMAHNTIGLVFNKQEKPDKALASFRKAVQLDPKMAIAHSNLGYQLMLQKDFDGAIKSCRRAIWLDPKLSLAYGNLAMALVANGEIEEAVSLCQRAISLDPELASAHGNLGATLLRQGKIEDAMAACQRAIELDPKLVTAHGTLGGAFARLGRSDKAVESYKRAVDLQPEYPLLRNYLASARTDADQETSLELLEKAADLCLKVGGPGHPDTITVINQLTSAYLEAERMDEAEALGERALANARDLYGERHEATLAAMINLGLIYFKLGRAAEAITIQEKLVELNREVYGPEHEDTLGGMTNLACSYDAAGRLDEAVTLQEEALAIKRRVLPEDHPFLSVAISRMAMLCEKTGRLEESFQLGEELVALKRKHLGPDHPDTLRAMLGREGLYYKAGDMEGLARTIAEHSEYLRRAGHGPESELQFDYQGQLAESARQLATGPVAEEAIARYYEDNKEAFKEDSVHLHMITIKRDRAGGDPAGERKRVEALRDQIAGGRPFAEVAREHSEDAWAEDGGDRENVERGTFRLDLDNAIFATKPGATGIHEDGKFIWLFQVGEREAGKVAPLEDVRPEVEGILRQRRRDELIQKWRDEAKQKVGTQE